MHRRKFLRGLLGVPLLVVPTASAAEEVPVQVVHLPTTEWKRYAIESEVMEYVPIAGHDLRGSVNLTITGRCVDADQLRELIDQINAYEMNV